MLNRPLQYRLRIISLLLTLLFTLLSACSDGNDNEAIQESTLGVPGAGNPNTVAVPAAENEGPIAGAPVLISSFYRLAPLGYEQAEYFMSGTANAYTNVNELTSDGNWQVEASEQTDYRTRIVVIRPSDPADFNGTVMVEWLNVTAGFDAASEWGTTHTEMMRSGYAWVGVSVQKVGVDALVDGSSAERYKSLHHPGDNYVFDIYSQVAQALREPGAVSPLGNLQAQHFIAAGQSQSAYYMVTHVNAFAPLHALYDGYLIHSRLSNGAGLQGEFLRPTIPVPEVLHIRDDLGTPVLMLQTESDLFILRSYPHNQQDSAKFRLWEVAGTAHADLYTFFDNKFDTGTNPAIAAVIENPSPVPGLFDCDFPVNAGPLHFVANAAVHALNAWVVDGTAPPTADRLEVAGEPAAFVLDALGNVQGGVRTPYVDAPIAQLSGEGQGKVSAVLDVCAYSGTTKLFDAATLGSLYTDNAAYIDALNTATDEAVSKGFLRPADADLIKEYAAGSDIFAP